jgi:hypothetical protein
LLESCCDDAELFDEKLGRLRHILESEIKAGLIWRKDCRGCRPEVKAAILVLEIGAYSRKISDWKREDIGEPFLADLSLAHDRYL